MRKCWLTISPREVPGRWSSFRPHRPIAYCVLRIAYCVKYITSYSIRNTQYVIFNVTVKSGIPVELALGVHQGRHLFSQCNRPERYGLLPDGQAEVGLASLASVRVSKSGNDHRFAHSSRTSFGQNRCLANKRSVCKIILS